MKSSSRRAKSIDKKGQGFMVGVQMNPILGIPSGYPELLQFVLDHVEDKRVEYLLETSDILNYEVLDIPLLELQGLKTLKVALHHSTKDEVVIHTIRLPKRSTIGDVINDLKTKVNFCNCLCTSIRCGPRLLQGFLNA
ncbi:ubiquitin C-terminal hydrolase 12-like isoform X2 [Magnolia sinica]|uniref:ubiquitin C-terminal hydrolase 12-like isoform X2 n=1 Tax=Magnolia sinica TaxID=86752 RepID=UPI00265B5FE7|nr:ubiquitin C-terminal hydrolase 12-like isoform X2 [Magnolia sinica]